MVQLPEAHSHMVAILGNQRLNGKDTLIQPRTVVHTVHSCRDTFTTTTGVNVVVMT